MHWSWQKTESGNATKAISSIRRMALSNSIECASTRASPKAFSGAFFLTRPTIFGFACIYRSKGFVYLVYIYRVLIEYRERFELFYQKRHIHARLYAKGLYNYTIVRSALHFRILYYTYIKRANVYWILCLNQAYCVFIWKSKCVALCKSNGG